jgi:CRP-like cAMP-binding protein
MDLELLKKTAIFADLDEGELARVAEICKEQTYEGGHFIFREGEPGNRFYIILKGEVRISRRSPGPARRRRVSLGLLREMAV